MYQFDNQHKISIYSMDIKKFFSMWFSEYKLISTDIDHGPGLFPCRMFMEYSIDLAPKQIHISPRKLGSADKEICTLWHHILENNLLKKYVIWAI